MLASGRVRESRFRGIPMAMANESKRKNTAQGTIAAYFTNGHDAQEAITDLLDNGFSASDVGAAFHSGGSQVGGVRGAGSGVADDRDAGDLQARSSSGTVSAAAVAGPASSSGAVTPAGLQTGAGTITTGAGRPGPIPGSEIPSSLPTKIPSTLPSEAEMAATERARADATYYPGTGGIHDTRREEGESWWDKLKHIFSGESTTAGVQRRREAVSDKSSVNFGTGEGHLGVYPGYAYSSQAFESVFAGMGVPVDRARYLSSQIGRGGAIVTVNAGARVAEAEGILERHDGEIRYETAVVIHAESGASESARVEIFGQVERAYPGYAGPDYAQPNSGVVGVGRRKVS
jgi:hypothetical protein